MDKPTPLSSPKSKSSYLSIIILGSFVALIGIVIVATNSTLTSLENQQSLLTSPKTSAPDTLDEEIDQQIRTLNSGNTLGDIDKDINTTSIDATDEEIRFLEQEMELL